MSDPEGLDQHLLEIVSECLQRLESEGESALDEVCATHPERAEAIRRHVDKLRGMGLLAESEGPKSEIDVGLAETLQERPRAPTGPPSVLEEGTRYVLKGEIARGGMGTVLRVFDKDLRRHLAMKVALVPGADLGEKDEVDPKLLGRFLEEAQVTGQLEHPGIVPVHEIGVDARGRMFFTMRLVKGETFKDVIDHVHDGDEGWTLTRALGVLQKVCEAMAFAHEKQVLHRDLKPANVMVGRFGETYVMDWGLARVLGRDDGRDIRLKDAPTSASMIRTDRQDAADSDPDSPLVTMDGDVVGTPAYMAPEQAEGRIDELAPPADVYALGSMLYHLLCGHMPYVTDGARATPRTVLAMLLQGPPPPIHEEASGVSPVLAAICAKAMARRPADRYPDMGALSTDLRAWLEGRVVKAYASGPLHELRAWMARNRAHSLTVAAALLAVVALSVWAWLERDSALDYAVQASQNAQLASDSEKLMREERDRARDAEEAAVAAEQSANENAYRAGYQAALVALDLGDRAGAVRRFSALPARPNDWERGFIDLALDRSLFTLVGHEGAVTEISYRGDGAALATSSLDGTVRIWDVETGELQHVMGERGSAWRAVAWSADGASIAAGAADGSVSVFDVASGDERASWGASDRPIMWLAFTGNGMVLAASQDGTIRRLAESASPVLVARRIGNRAGPPFLHGDRLLLVRSDSLVEVASASSATGRVVFDRDNHTIGLALDPSGESLLAGTGGGTLRRFDLESGALQREWNLDSTALSAIAWSPDGAALAGAAGDSVLLWDAATTQLIGRLVGQTGRLSALAFSPDGSRIVGGGEDGTIRIWGAASATSDALDVDADRIDAACFDSAGERLVLAVSHEGLDLHPVLVIDAASGAETSRHGGHRAAVAALACSAESGVIASASTSGEVVLWDPVTGRPSWRATVLGRPEQLAFTGDGAHLLVAAASGRVRALDVASGRASFELPARGPVCVDSAGSILAVDPDSHQVVLLDASRLEVTARFSGLIERIVSVAVSPDGKLVAASAEDRTVHLWNRETGAVEHRFESDAPVRTVSFGADSSRLVCSRPGRVLVFDLEDGDGSSTWNVLLGADRESDHLLFGPRGHRVFCSGVGAPRLLHARPEHARRFWRATADRRRVEGIVAPLSLRLGVRDDVIAAIDRDVPPPLRPAAVARARRRDDPLAVAWSAEAWRALDPDRVRAAPEAGWSEARRAVLGAPARAETRRLLVWASLLSGDPDRAREEAELVWRLEPGMVAERFRTAVDAIATSLTTKGLDIGSAAATVAEQLSARGLRPALDVFRELHLSALRRLDPNAETSHSRAERRHELAKSVLLWRDARPQEYEAALRDAESAKELIPWYAPYVHTHGVAWYRTGRFDFARVEFERAGRLNRGMSPGYDPARDLAFLAMCHARLGDLDEAEAIRETIAPPDGHELDDETAGVILEMAETLARRE